MPPQNHNALPVLQKGLRKQGLKLQIRNQRFSICLKLLQKWSTKTRIETLLSPESAALLPTRCKSGLRKQGLKQYQEVYLLPALYWLSCKSGLRKQGLKRKIIVINRHPTLIVAKVV